MPDTPEESEARLARDIAHWEAHGFGRWAAEANGNLVGFGGVTRSAEFEGLNLSYHVHPDHWGQGYATELAQECIAFAFHELGERRIVGLARPANPASQHVLERVGFKYERHIELHGAPTMLFAVYPDG